MIERTVDAGGAPLVRIREGEGPVLAVALHAGHAIRPSLEKYLALSEDERLREEDPWTAQMAPVGTPLIEMLRSRFEVDLNRPRSQAVYQGPQDAWGLRVYRSGLPNLEDQASRVVYDSFYATAFDVLSRAVEEHGRFVVLDLHSYNHRRDGVGGRPADEDENPQVNLGTRHLGRHRWAGVVEGFLSVMNAEGFDCRENVKFGGGNFASWVSETFPDTGAVLAIEFKKTYMDEWTGTVDLEAVARIRSTLTGAIPVLTDAMSKIR